MAEIKTLMLKPTSLASAIGKTDTEITVETIYDIGGVTIKERIDDGESFSDIFGDEGQFTIAPRTDNTEVFTFTGITILSSGKVKLTGVTRGVKPFLPFGADLKYAKSHNSGEELVFSNTPIYYEQFVKLDGDQTFQDDMSFKEFPDKVGDLIPTENNQFATKKYIDDVSIAGAADATIVNKGIVEIATHAEVAAKTGTGGTGAKLVVPADEANIPTDDEKDAMRGTQGAPSSTNSFVTDEDKRLSTRFAIVAHIENSGVAGGGAVEDAWTTRALNTIVEDDDSIINSLSSNQVSLGAGTYIIKATTPWYNVSKIRLRIYDRTNSTTLLTGMNCWEIYNSIEGKIVLTGETSISLDYYVDYVNSSSANCGVAISSGDSERYATMSIYKIND